MQHLQKTGGGARLWLTSSLLASAMRRSGIRTRRRFNALFIYSCCSLSKECLRTLLKSKGSALFLKTAGCMGLLPIPELASFTSHGPAPTLSESRPLLHCPPMARQRLGQHFLGDLHWREQIARAIRVSPHSIAPLPSDERGLRAPIHPGD